MRWIGVEPRMPRHQEVDVCKTTQHCALWEFGTTSGQLRERKNGFLAPKRYQMKQLDFLILLLESRRSSPLSEGLEVWRKEKRAALRKPHAAAFHRFIPGFLVMAMKIDQIRSVILRDHASRYESGYQRQRRRKPDSHSPNQVKPSIALGDSR